MAETKKVDEPEQAKQIEGELAEKDKPEDPAETGFFPDINPETGVTELASMCMNCHDWGTTRLLLTKIPFFKEIILMSFSCDHCNFRDSEVQFGGEIQKKGITWKVQVRKQQDLSRQIIKAETGVLTVPALEFEIPAGTQRGSVNTIEGFLVQTADALEAGQADRKAIDPETTAKIEEFIGKLRAYADGQVLPFEVVLDDPSGNSWIENPLAPSDDPQLTVSHYIRNPLQNVAVGLAADHEAVNVVETVNTPFPEEPPHGSGYKAGPKVVMPEGHSWLFGPKDGQRAASDDPNALVTPAQGDYQYEEEQSREVMSMTMPCSDCGKPVENRMVVTAVPHFKEVIVMASNCDNCGARSNEVRVGGGISPVGRRITLHYKNEADSKRDVLKSETSSLNIPELELSLGGPALGGRFTTVEGLLVLIKEQLSDNPFMKGDSSTNKAHMDEFMLRLDKLIDGNEPFTLILIYEDYVRNEEQNEDLGIAQMKTENY